MNIWKKTKSTDLSLLGGMCTHQELPSSAHLPGIKHGPGTELLLVSPDPLSHTQDMESWRQTALLDIWSPYLTRYCELPMTSGHSKSSLTSLLWLSLLETDLQKEICYSALMVVVATGIFCIIFHTGFIIHFVLWSTVISTLVLSLGFETSYEKKYLSKSMSWLI